MVSEQLINVLEKWGKSIKSLDEEKKADLYADAANRNPWFTPDNLDLAFEGLDRYLDKSKLEQWLKNSHFDTGGRKVGIVMAGNVPMVGFHDMLSTIVSGNTAVVKLSSQDDVLIPFLIGLLSEISPDLADQIEFADKLKGVDAVIATGSDNSSRYFEYYFRDIPHVIRKNRTSVAILDGTESEGELLSLGRDILNYFGLGCRNVSKLFVPAGYDFKAFFEAIEPLSQVNRSHKYVNNYDYNKSIYLVNKTPFFDNGFLLVTESSELVSPISTVYYEHYASPSIQEVQSSLDSLEDKIQCFVTAAANPGIDFGNTQVPDLWDYADNVDTLDFLGRI